MTTQMILIYIFQSLFLFLAVRWSMINFSRLLRKDAIPYWNFIWQALGITGFVMIQWIIK